MTLHDERVTYETVKAWVLEAYFDFCRDRGVVSGRSHAEVLGGVSYEYEESFKRPIEHLMLALVFVVLNGGWYEQPMAYYRKRVQEILAKHGIDELLADVPVEEAALFRHDLRVLKFL